MVYLTTSFEKLSDMTRVGLNDLACKPSEQSLDRSRAEYGSRAGSFSPTLEITSCSFTVINKDQILFYLNKIISLKIKITVFFNNKLYMSIAITRKKF